MSLVTVEVDVLIKREQFDLVGTGSTVTALSDNSDGTYLKMLNHAYGTCSLGVASFTPPVGQVMLRWRLGVRHGATTGSSGPRSFSVDYATSPFNHNFAFTASSAIVTSYSPWITVSGSNAFIDTATLTIKAPWPQGDLRSNIYKMFVEIEYNTPPVGSVVAPIGTISSTSKPMIEIGYTDTESDPMGGFAVSVLDATATELIWTSGAIVDGSMSIRCPIALPNATYTVVGLVFQSLGNFYSTWFGGSFEIDMPLAAAPTITNIVADDSTFGISFTITGAVHALHSPIATTLERSLDGGTTWTVLRDDIVLDGSLKANFVDYTAPIGIYVSYRAKVLYALDSDTDQQTLSTYSTTTTSVSLNPLDVVWFIRDAHTTPAVLPFEVDVKAPNPWTMTSDEEMAAFSALGRKYPIIVSDVGVRGWSWSNIVLEFTDEAVYNAFMTMRNAQHSFELYYVPTNRSNIMRIRGSVKVTESNTVPIIWSVTFDAVEVERPRV